MKRLFSVACRPVYDHKYDAVTARGHGGMWSESPAPLCPTCGRPMTLTGAVSVRKLKET